MVTYRAGIDVGSTTVKLAVLDEEGKILYGEYRRHYSHTQKTLAEMLAEVKDKLGDCRLRLRITGSGAINLGKALDIPFVQEVVAVSTALSFAHPKTDCAIELGGEDAKIIYFRPSLEERMNGVCAGGTGSFIDQMAALLQTDATGLNEAAADYKTIYPIAARCGVFAKTDIQPLINEGATRADLAASIFQAVVNQTISGLACGKPIRGHVAFLGGPLHFLPELKKAFIRTLKLTDEAVIDPENSHLFAAMGAALEATEGQGAEATALAERLSRGVEMDFEIKRLDPLFASKEEFDVFSARHAKAKVKRDRIEIYEGDCFLGIDAGSTTTKLALIGDEGQLLWSFYASNQGSPLRTCKEALADLAFRIPKGATIRRSCSTGYGEALLKAALRLDEGEVETIAHCTAASFFDPEVDCVLDIGGQDMKCIKLRDGSVDNVLLNEACSSGCGSFIENFAASLGFTAAAFADEALYAAHPVDLGTRCTVFMNSNVKQAQKEGATVADISAGLAYSVIKNALFKVIKLSRAEDLGKRIVLQGGTFHNRAVLRAFEKIAGVEAVCPDISGIMGAFGAALIAKNRYHGQESSMLTMKQIEELSYSTTAARCKGCENRCTLTVNRFSDGRRFITGNRCEKGAGNATANDMAPNLYVFKELRLFSYEPLDPETAKRGVIGMPRVLNMYENYPFWATMFRHLGFSVKLSPPSDRHIYELGMESIPSESECYPAKLAHGHVQWLIDAGVKTIFHPSVFYERQETKGAQNHYNCPMVIAYPENLKNNVEDVTEGRVEYLRPFLAMTDLDTVTARMVEFCAKTWNIPASEVKDAVKAAWEEQEKAKADIRAEGARVFAQMQAKGGRGIVLAGRPYHVDPQIHHGIPEMIASYGLTVFSEDSLPVDFEPSRPVRVNDQWVYHSRLYTAAEFVTRHDDLELIQLNSFGCGLDAVTTDEVSELMEKSGKLYTVLKIDEVSGLGAARIRLRSLIAAMNLRQEKGIKASPVSAEYHRTEYTKEMQDAGYTIIAPQMSPIHFSLIEPLFRKYGYQVVILENDNRTAIDTGLQYVNNDACFPAITTIGQIMEAVLSGKYDTDKLAIMMSQTGGCCRASNYVAFIRRALDKVGLSHIPVISLNFNGMETNEGFKLTPKMILEAGKGLAIGDLLMKCLYRTRPYEAANGAANALHSKWEREAIAFLTGKSKKHSYKSICRAIVKDFDELPLVNDRSKPRVGVVGEILVKYMPLANNHLVDLLEREGAEAVVPDLLDFFQYSVYNGDYQYRFLGGSIKKYLIAHLGWRVIDFVRAPATKALKKSKRFAPPVPIKKIAQMAKPFISLGNQYGEGWFLTGEMIELIESGAPNIVCIQPFACLPNHVVGKGVIKVIRAAHPEANIAAVDYDPGASEVNQLNRIKLMLSVAVKRMEKGEKVDLSVPETEQVEETV